MKLTHELKSEKKNNCFVTDTRLPFKPQVLILIGLELGGDYITLKKKELKYGEENALLEDSILLMESNIAGWKYSHF